MLFLILFVVVYSLLVALAYAVIPNNISNPFLSYYYIQGKFIQDNFLLFVISCIIFTLFYSLFKKQEHKIIKKLTLFLQKLIVASVFGSIASFFLLFVIAFIQMNAMSLLSNISPKILGTKTKSEEIVETLKDKSFPPKVIARNTKEGLLLPTIALAQSGKETFYGNRIIPNVPKFLLIPIKKTGSGVLMVGDTLIVSRINSSDFQEISPIVSHLYISDYFSGIDIKSYPEVALINKEEYRKYRKEDFKKKIELIGKIVSEADENGNSLVETIDEDEKKILENQENLDQAKTQREREYIKCVNAGYYEDGKYIRINSKEECQEQTVSLAETVDLFEQEGKELKNSLENKKRKLEQYQDFIEYYTSQKQLTQEESAFVSYEFASFEPPDKIKLAITSENNPQALADYLVLLIHEYLHYSSYKENGNRLTSAFFTEGLTEYFSRNIIRKYLGIETKMGYPANVRIIEQMSKRISENDLARIYFNNNQNDLEELIDLVYRENFYSDNIITLETLHYSSDKEQILNLANDIMVEIGGDQLIEEDLKTTQSIFEAFN